MSTDGVSPTRSEGSREATVAHVMLSNPSWESARSEPHAGGCAASRLGGGAEPHAVEHAARPHSETRGGGQMVVVVAVVVCGA